MRLLRALRCFFQKSIRLKASLERTLFKTGAMHEMTRSNEIKMMNTGL